MEPFLTAERDRYWLGMLKKNRELEEKVRLPNEWGYGSRVNDCAIA